MRLLSTFCLLLSIIICASPALAAREARSCSMPAISADGRTVYFGCWGDIWAAPADGGAPAWRLTDNVALEERPMPSPDGRQLAFLSDRFGNFDVFVMPIDGGPATRLTYSDNPDQHYAWKPDGSAVLEYARRQDLWGYCGYEIPLDGSELRRVTGPAHDHHIHVNYLGDSEHFVYSRGPADWAKKRYRGSRNYDLWTYDAATGEHTQLTDFEGKDLWPQPSPDGSVVYFVSDRDGTENLWSLEMASGELRQLTHFSIDGPRWPRISSDGDEIVFEVFGDLYLLALDGGPARKIEITFADDAKHEMRLTRDFQSNAGEYALSPNGNYFAVTVLGDIFLLKNPDSYEEDAEPDQDLSRTRPLVLSPGREKDLSWHPESTKLAYVSDRDGQYDLYVLDLVKLEETRLTDTPVEEALPQFAPAGDRIAYYSGNRELRLYDLDSGEDMLLHEGTMKWGPWPNGMSWAPDGYWLVFAIDHLDYQQELYLMNIRDREAVPVTRAMDWNGGTVFSADGKYLAFTHSFDDGADVMLLELDPEQPTYDLELLFPDDLPDEEDDEEAAEDEDGDADEEATGDEDDEADGDEDGAGDEDDDEISDDPYADLEPTTIDVNRIHLRARSLTGFTGEAHSPLFDPESEYLVFVSEHTGDPELWSISLEGDDLNLLGSAADKDYAQFAPDGKRLYYLEGGRVAYLEMNGGRSGGGGSVRITSRLEYDQYRIWEQILTEGWRVIDQSFYDARHGGADWDNVLSRYLPRVREIGTTYEYGRLYREMLGELGRSHLGYWGYGDEREAPADTTGSLGVIWDEGYDGPGWRVARIIPDGPATVPGAELYEGDVILELGGEELAPRANRAHHLNNWAGRPLKLTVQNGPAALEALSAAAEEATEDDEAADEAEEPDETRDLVILPAAQASMRTPLYEQWVEDNRQRVYDASDGRIGYQHIRRMYASSLTRFRSELFTESVDKEALIIDVRFNSGGYTAVDVKSILDEAPAYLRARRDDPVMNFGRQYVWQGPLVLLVNAYSFSNAEIFAHIMKDSGMATIIGEPTPGGVISTSQLGMLDGSTLAIPSGGNFRLSGEDMEGPGGGAVPDIIVLIDPQVVEQGGDNQLDAAIEHLLGILE